MSNVTGTGSPIAAAISARLPTLSAAEAKAASTILEQGDNVVYLSASEVADLAGAALSTVVRACQKLGFKGYQDLKIALAREYRPLTISEAEEGVQPTDAPAVVLAKVSGAAREAIESGVAQVDPDAFTEAAGAVASAGRLLCVSVGTSAPLAQDAGYRFQWIGVRADAPADVHAQHVAATLLGPGDVALVVSHSGATRETVAAAEAARQAGAAVVAVTSFLRSPLTQHATISLIPAARSRAWLGEALASRIALMTVIDALWVATTLARRDAATDVERVVADVLAAHRF